MAPPDQRLEALLAGLEPDPRAHLMAMRKEAACSGLAFLERRLASLPRRIGRQPVAAEVMSLSDAQVDLRSYRACDLAAALLLGDVPDVGAVAPNLFNQGDPEERRMLLKSLPFFPTGEWSGALLDEAHRSNDQTLFEAGLLDSDLPARLLPESSWNRAVLKTAFLDLPVDRMLGWEGRANPDLSLMLLDFMSEREAAGRPAWADSLRVAARSPIPGVLERVLGDLWHGEVRRRRAASLAAAGFPSQQIRPSLEARLGREADPDVRRHLSLALAQAPGGALPPTSEVRLD